MSLALGVSTTLLGKIVVPIVAALGPMLTLFGLPGTWLALVVAGLFEWGTEPRLFSDATVLGTVLLAIAGEAWEFSASSIRAKRAGAGRRGSVGALLGGIAGAIAGTLVLPLIGTLIGGGLGALGASAALERAGGRSTEEALRIGRAAATGQMLGVAGKFTLAVIVWLWLTIAVWA